MRFYLTTSSRVRSLSLLWALLLLGLLVPVVPTLAQSEPSPESSDTTVVPASETSTEISQESQDDEQPFDDDRLISPEEQLNERSFEQFTQGDYPGALATLQALLQRYQAQQNYALMGETLNGIALIQEALGDPDAALDAYQQALETYAALAPTDPEQSKSGEAYTLNSMGSVYAALGQPEAALGFVERSLVLFRELGASDEEAITLLNLGSLYASVNRLSDAIQTLQQALSIQQQRGNLIAVLSTLERLSSVYAQAGAFAEAARTLEQAIDQAMAAEDFFNAAIFLTRLAELAELTRDFGAAIEAYQTSLNYLQNLDEPIAQLQILGRLGNLYTETNQVEAALNSYEQAVTIAAAQGDILQEGQILLLMGMLHHQADAFEAAQQAYEQSLSLVQPLGVPLAEAQILRGLGEVYYDTGDTAKAFELTELALSRQQEIENAATNPVVQQEAGITLNLLGDLYRAQQQYEQALMIYEQALEKHEQAQDPVGKGETLRDVGVVLLFQGEPLQAVEPLFEAVEIWEFLSYNTGIILEPIAEAYQILQAALIAAEQIDGALVVAEQERSLPIRFQRGWQEGLQALPPGGLTLEQIQQTSASQTAPLVFYDIGTELVSEDQRSIPKLNIWLVLPTGEISLRQVNLEDFGITELPLLLNLIEAAQGVANGESPIDSTTDALQQLSALMLEPLTSDVTLPEAEALFVIPPPGLSMIPLESLQFIPEDGAQSDVLGDHYTVQVASSVQAIVLQIGQLGATPAPSPDSIQLSPAPSPDSEASSSEP